MKLREDNALSMLQEAYRLDDEVRMIMTSGYKPGINKPIREHFKPFMLRELLQVIGKSYRPAGH